MKRLICYAKPYYVHILLAALASVGCSVANIWVIDVLKQVIDETIAGEVGGMLPKLVGKVMLVVVVGLCSNYLVISMTGHFGAGILRDLRREALLHIMKASPDFGEKNNFGDIMERLSSDIEGLAGYMQTYFKDCLYVPFIVTALAIYLFQMNPVLALTCLAPLAVLVPLSISRLRPVKLAQAEYVKMLGLTNNHIQEAFDGADVIKAYNLQKTMEKKYYDALKETFDISNQNDLRQYHVVPISEMIHELPIALALCAGGYLVLQGGITMGMLVAFVSALQKLNAPLVNAYQLVVRTQMAMVAVKRVFYVMDLPVEEAEGEAETDKIGIEKTDIEKNVAELFRFHNVSFAYRLADGSRKKVIENLHLVIQKGKKTALVGASGSGKSTLVKLLCRQYEIEEGELFYYGRSFRDISPKRVREDIALISQEASVFAMSVLDNIRIGNPDADREQVVQAAALAGCDEFIRNMPEGYDSQINEKGSNLSGGQRQRISIARAILKDAEILILDEPTSALDKETEAHINRTIFEIAQNKTVITVAHRLTTVMDYDEIIVLEDGHIVERGNHEQLMGQKGCYYEMFREYMMSGGACK